MVKDMQDRNKEQRHAETTPGAKGPIRDTHDQVAEMGRALHELGSLRPRAHDKAYFLWDGLQHLTLDGLCDKRQLLAQGLMAVAHSDVWHIGAADVIALGTLLGIVGSQPVAFYLQRVWVTGTAAGRSNHHRDKARIPNAKEGKEVMPSPRQVEYHTLWEKPLMSTLLRASSHMSQELSFQT